MVTGDYGDPESECNPDTKSYGDCMYSSSIANMILFYRRLLNFCKLIIRNLVIIISPIILIGGLGSFAHSDSALAISTRQVMRYSHVLKVAAKLPPRSPDLRFHIYVSLTPETP